MVPALNKHDARSKHNSRNTNKASGNRARGSRGHCEPFSSGFREQSPLRKSLGYKEDLDWLKIDLTAADIITVQDYKRTKN